MPSALSFQSWLLLMFREYRMRDALLAGKMPISFKAGYFWRSLNFATILDHLSVEYFFLSIKSMCCWKRAESDWAKKLCIEAMPSKGICFFPRFLNASSIILSSPIAKIWLAFLFFREFLLPLIFVSASISKAKFFFFKYETTLFASYNEPESFLLFM